MNLRKIKQNTLKDLAKRGGRVGKEAKIELAIRSKRSSKGSKVNA